MQLFFLKFTFYYPFFDSFKIGPKGEHMQGKIMHSDIWIDINLQDTNWLTFKDIDTGTSIIQAWAQFVSH